MNKPNRTKTSRATKRSKFIHVVSPATATEIRKTLGITRQQIKNICAVCDEAGVKYK